MNMTPFRYRDIRENVYFRASEIPFNFEYLDYALKRRNRWSLTFVPQIYDLWGTEIHLIREFDRQQCPSSKSQALLHLRHIVWNGYVTEIIRFRYADKFYTSQAGIKFTGRPSSSAMLQGCWCRRLGRFQLVSL